MGISQLFSFMCLNSSTSICHLSGKVFSIKARTVSLFLLSWGKADCGFNVLQWCAIECSPSPSGNDGKKLGIPHVCFFLLDWLTLYHFSVFRKLIVFAVLLVSQACIWIYDFCSMWPFCFSIILEIHSQSSFLFAKNGQRNRSAFIISVFWSCAR